MCERHSSSSTIWTACSVETKIPCAFNRSCTFSGRSISALYSSVRPSFTSNSFIHISRQGKGEVTFILVAAPVQKSSRSWPAVVVTVDLRVFQAFKRCRCSRGPRGTRPRPDVPLWHATTERRDLPPESANQKAKTKK